MPPTSAKGKIGYREIPAIGGALANGGELVEPVGADAPEVTARFGDPAGNVLGLCQEPARSSPSGR